MNFDSKFPDPLTAWHKVLERLYHEDHILYARMNNFSTVQAFLATALAFTTSATTAARNISLIVSLFGLALSLFYISLGFRGVCVIQFWRSYLRLLESIPGVTPLTRTSSSSTGLDTIAARRRPNCLSPRGLPSESTLSGGLAVLCMTNFPGTSRASQGPCSSPSAFPRSQPPSGFSFSMLCFILTETWAGSCLDLPALLSLYFCSIYSRVD